MYKNLPKQAVLQLKDLVQYQPGQVVSRTLVQNDRVSMTLFSFDQGEEISAHASGGDAMVNLGGFESTECSSYQRDVLLFPGELRARACLDPTHGGPAMTYLLHGMLIGLIFSVAASAVGVYRTDQPAEKEDRRAASSRYSAAFAASRC